MLIKIGVTLKRRIISLSKVFFAFISFSIIFLLLSCSSDNPVSPSYSSYFPLTVGSYWKYIKYPLFDDGSKYDELVSYYLTKVTQNQQVLGEKATEFSYFSSNDTLNEPNIKISKNYFIFKNDKIYTLLSYFFNNIISQGSEKDKWVLIADFTSKPNDQWIIIKDLELNREQIPPNEGIGQRIYYGSLLCKRGNDTTLNINGKLVSAVKFVFIYTYKTVTEQVGSPPIEVSFSRNEEKQYWLSPNIGVVLIRENLPLEFRIDNKIINAFISELVDFKVY